MKTDSLATLICLAGLALALVVVGIVSDTILRHLVQIVPVVAAMTFVTRRPAIGAYAALPIFMFWTLIVSLIWLFLMGLSRIANGHYTIAEIASTFVMAICCLLGTARAVRLGRAAPIPARILIFVVFAVLQVAAMGISFSPSIATR